MKAVFDKATNNLIIKLDGEIDQSRAARIRSFMDGEISKRMNIGLVSIDLGGVSFMDSSGIGILLGRYKLARSIGAGFAVSNAKPDVEKVLRIAGIYTLTGQDRGGKAR